MAKKNRGHKKPVAGRTGSRRAASAKPTFNVKVTEIGPDGKEKAVRVVKDSGMAELARLLGGFFG